MKRQRVRLDEEVAPAPVEARRREPTQQRDWPFRLSWVDGRGWVRNVPPAAQGKNLARK